MKNYLFTISIFLAALIAYNFPQYFIEINGFPLKKLIIPLLQVIMFGMGTTMSKEDFMGVVRMPKAVLIGLICQFTIMPFLGFFIAKAFNFPPEIAAGVLLVGCSPSGLASNVMAYIAKANVALSITITSCATLLAPILTPFLMKSLGGEYIDIEFWGMFWDIAQMVILPVAVGYLLNLVLGKKGEWLQRVLPVVSMVGIALIIVVITAAGQKSLQTVGFSLILATLLHNLGGFLLGYWGARFSGLAEQDCRTVAIEVGLQNAGLASGLAVTMGKMTTVGIAPALFGPIMNISGSILAGWWSKK
ncbi:MAG: bile acid:sodium symporter family protein [Saprospiraceae bacterium]|nr:bile acid:sodium symporter family protein [Saprospiraceae bacterium]